MDVDVVQEPPTTGADVFRSINKLVDVIYRRLPTQDQTLLDRLRDLLLICRMLYHTKNEPPVKRLIRLSSHHGLQTSKLTCQMTEQFLFTVNHSVMNLSFYLRISPQSNH
jgi:hypothetical protein